jgi:hypothetical protein
MTIPLSPMVTICNLFAHKGKQYIRKQHDDNERAFTKSSTIWQLGDEYEKLGNGHQKKNWRCGLCSTKTTMLAMKDSSSAGLLEELVGPRANCAAG